MRLDSYWRVYCLYVSKTRKGCTKVPVQRRAANIVTGQRRPHLANSFFGTVLLREVAFFFVLKLRWTVLGAVRRGQVRVTWGNCHD